MKETVVITGGGTGGHLKVADAFIQEYFDRGCDVIFIGSSNGQDKFWFENDNRITKKYFLDTRGVVNKKFIGKIFSLFNIFMKTLKCRSIYSKFNIKTVISVGGYSAAASSFATILKPSCNLYIHEQNSRMGKLNQVTARFAKEVFSSFHSFSPIKDYPVSDVFFKKARIRKEIKTVAFFGGSQGAVAINDFALKLAKKLNEKGIRIIHQTGKNDFSRVKEQYEKLGINADVFDFTKDIPSKMQEADFAISRAGASTLWEMCANNLPAYFVPYKFAASNHQYFNAKDLVEKNMAFISLEDELDEEKFFEALSCDISLISERLKKSISPNGVNLIVEYISKNK